MVDRPHINLERSLYYGVFFMALCFGLELYMFAHSLHLYLRSSPSLKRHRLAYVSVGAVNLALTAIAITVNAVFMQFMWIDYRDVDGGPLGYLAANSSVWWQTFGSAAGQTVNFLGDGLMIHRCYVVWGGRWLIIVFPIILYLGQLVMAVMSTVQSATPGSNFFQGATVNYGVPFVALSVALNITVTVLIIYQLLTARNQLRGVLPEDALRMYTGIAAILVESALPFTMLGIIAAILYGKNSDTAPAFVFVWATFAALSPQFIIFRVTGGMAWTQDIASDVKATTTNGSRFHSRSEIPSRGTTTTLNDMSFTTSKSGQLETVEESEMEFMRRKV